MESPGVRRVLLCLLVDVGGVGMRVGGNIAAGVIEGGSIADGRRECDLEFDMDGWRLARDGRGRLLKVRLRGMPPSGSSGRQT